MILALAACSVPDPAPTELEDLIGWMYGHLADDEPAALGEGSVNLDRWTDAHLDETLEGYQVDVLTDEIVATLGAGERDLEGLEGVAVGYEHAEHMDVDALARGVMVDPRETRPDMYLEYESEELEGTRECFGEGTCDWLEYTSHAVQDLGLGVLMTIDAQVQARRYDTPLGEAWAYRYWTTEPPELSTDLVALDQTYFFWAFVPHGDRVRSMQASWVVVQVLDADLDSDLVLHLWVKGMIDGAREIDEAGE
ncbi:MAG: hypothetical protein FJ090_03640 [Deltaproteobacteria bacterium]|nr:hypothetical protein [Deltaproteobacteria bacterium]